MSETMSGDNLSELQQRVEAERAALDDPESDKSAAAQEAVAVAYAALQALDARLAPMIKARNELASALSDSNTETPVVTVRVCAKQLKYVKVEYAGDALAIPPVDVVTD